MYTGKQVEAMIAKAVEGYMAKANFHSQPPHQPNNQGTAQPQANQSQPTHQPNPAFGAGTGAGSSATASGNHFNAQPPNGSGISTQPSQNSNPPPFGEFPPYNAFSGNGGGAFSGNGSGFNNGGFNNTRFGGNGFNGGGGFNGNFGNVFGGGNAGFGN